MSDDLRKTVLDHMMQCPEALSDEQLAEILAHRVKIEQAKGMLMCAYGINAETAFKVLRSWSQARNVKLRLLAAKLVDDLTALTPAQRLDMTSVFDDLLFSSRVT
jgi:hypothetical protein